MLAAGIALMAVGLLAVGLALALWPRPSRPKPPDPVVRIVPRR